MYIHEDLLYLISIALELAELNTLFQLDPPNRAHILDVNLPLLDVLEEDLHPGLAIVLAVGHQVDARVVKMLEEILAPLSDLVSGRLNVVEMLAEISKLNLGFFDVTAGNFGSLKLLGPKLVLRRELQK